MALVLNSADSAALHYLHSGAVTVLSASTPDDGPRAPLYVHALVAGHRVFLRTGRWSCSCPYEGCAHIAPVALITGHSTSVRPTP
ncbi:hypothetical protein ACFFMN_33735 [Planobispora siamensis]|uniref:SWIM-type domain-containing protein n=1 Tax=Planobispora siamensis TaxID=936338 RepID=A0A8J3SCR0_9ACTN|nr:hypothetical protein [Planobispora siamensis]GIH91987.1 hypothetical protein Psi01_26170 [Planobispora siamensis]